jgi:hypothetical protein
MGGSRRSAKIYICDNHVHVAARTIRQRPILRRPAVLTHGKCIDFSWVHLRWPSTWWESIMGSVANAVHREPWNKGKLVGQKAPFKLKDIWALRVAASRFGAAFVTPSACAGGLLGGLAGASVILPG